MCYKCMLLGAAVRASCFDLSRLREGDFFFPAAPPSALVDAAAQAYLQPVLEKMAAAGCVMTPVRVDGDGNCLVHAISRALGGNEMFYSVLRQKMFRELRDHKSFYRRAMGGAFVEDGEEGYQAELNRAMPTSRSVSWLSPLHIFAMSNVLRRPIVLFDGSAEPSGSNACGIYVPSRFSPDQCRLSTNEMPSPIAIAWSSPSLNHYVCLSYEMSTPRVSIGDGVLGSTDNLGGARRALLKLRECASSGANALHQRCLEFLLTVIDDCCGSQSANMPMFLSAEHQCVVHPDFPDLDKVGSGVRMFLASIGFVVQPAGAPGPIDTLTRFKDDIFAKNVSATTLGLRALLLAHQSSLAETCDVEADGEALSHLVRALSHPNDPDVFAKTIVGAGGNENSSGRLGIVGSDSMTIARTHRRGLMCLGKLASLALTDPRPITKKNKASYNSLIDMLRRVLVSPDLAYAIMPCASSAAEEVKGGLRAPRFSPSVPVRLCLRVLNAQLATADAPADPPDIGLGLVGVKNAIRLLSNALAIHTATNVMMISDTPLNRCALEISETTMRYLNTLAEKVEAIIRRKCKIANADEKKARHAKGICHAASVLVGNISFAYISRRRLGAQRTLPPAALGVDADAARTEIDAREAERSMIDAASRTVVGIATAYFIKSKKAGMPLQDYASIDKAMLRGVHTVLSGDRRRGSKLVEYAVFERGLVEALEGRSGPLVYAVLSDCNIPRVVGSGEAKSSEKRPANIMRMPVVNLSLMAVAKLLVKGELSRASTAYRKICPGVGCGSVCAVSKEDVESEKRFVCPTCGTDIIYDKTDELEQIKAESGLFPEKIPFGLDEALFGSVQFSLGLTCAVRKDEEKGGEKEDRIIPWSMARKYANAENGWRFGTGDDLLVSVLSVQHDLESAFEKLTGRTWEAAKIEDFSRMCTCRKCGSVYYSPVTDRLGRPLDDPRKITNHAEWAIRIQPCPTCSSVDIEGETLDKMSKMMRFHDTVMAVHTAGVSTTPGSAAEEVSAVIEATKASLWVCEICGTGGNRAILPHCEACRVRRVFK